MALLDALTRNAWWLAVSGVLAVLAAAVCGLLLAWLLPFRD